MDNTETLHDLIFKPIANNIGDNRQILNNPSYINNINKRLISHPHEFQMFLLLDIENSSLVDITDLINAGLNINNINHFRDVLTEIGIFLLNKFDNTNMDTVDYIGDYNLLFKIFNIYNVPANIYTINRYIFKYKTADINYIKCLNLIIDNILQYDNCVPYIHNHYSLYEYIFEYIHDFDIAYNLTKKLLNVVNISQRFINDINSMVFVNDKGQNDKVEDNNDKCNNNDNDYDTYIDPVEYSTQLMKCLTPDNKNIIERMTRTEEKVGLYSRDTTSMFNLIKNKYIQGRFLGLFRYYRKERNLQQLCLLNAISYDKDISNIPQYIITPLKNYSVVIDIKRINKCKKHMAKVINKSINGIVKRKKFKY